MSREEQHDQHLKPERTGGVLPGGRGSPEDDLPPELKSVEAALASLAPRIDRLDRDRLMFLAGEQSATSGRRGPVRSPHGWAWPGAFSAMTAVAAALLVMLIARPEKHTVEILRVPVSQASNDRPSPDGVSAAPPAESGVPGPATVSPSGSEPRRGPQPRTFVRLPWLEASRRLGGPAQASYPCLLHRVLTHGLESWEPPAAAEDSSPPAGPASYRELRDDLLDDTVSASWPVRPVPTTSMFLGVS